MRHRVKGKKLGRSPAHRKALLRNMSDSLVIHEKIETTLAKAKYLRPYFEKLLTKAKNVSDSDDKIAKYNVIKYLRGQLTTKTAIKKLMDEVAPRFKNVKGGYTRIVRTGERKGDNADMARIELTIFSETKKTAKEETKITKRDKKEVEETAEDKNNKKSKQKESKTDKILKPEKKETKVKKEKKDAKNK